MFSPFVCVQSIGHGLELFRGAEATSQKALLRYHSQIGPVDLNLPIDSQVRSANQPFDRNTATLQEAELQNITHRRKLQCCYLELIFYLILQQHSAV